MSDNSFKLRKEGQRGYFVHIPKTAGGSIRRFCREAAIVVIGHDLRSPEYRLFRSFPDRDHLFSFAFVRHPVDRAYSAFSFLSQGGINADDRNDAEKFVTPYAGDFNKFVEQEVTRGDVLQQIHFLPQFEWIVDEQQKVCVDFIGRYERLEQDYAKLVNLLDIGDHPLPVRNKSNKQQIEISPQSQDILKSAYARDFELFGYTL